MLILESAQDYELRLRHEASASLSRTLSALLASDALLCCLRLSNSMSKLLGLTGFGNPAKQDGTVRGHACHGGCTARVGDSG